VVTDKAALAESCGAFRASPGMDVLSASVLLPTNSHHEVMIHAAYLISADRERKQHSVNVNDDGTENRFDKDGPVRTGKVPRLYYSVSSKLLALSRQSPAAPVCQRRNHKRGPQANSCQKLPVFAI